jgi:hypothetical protein
VSNGVLLMKLLHLRVFPLKIISIGRYAPLLVSLPAPEASPEVI